MILLQVIFEGIVGNSYLGDIAVDDVSMTDGPCNQGRDGKLQLKFHYNTMNFLVIPHSLYPISTVANVENNEIRIEKNNISGHIFPTFLSHYYRFASHSCHIILHSPPFTGQTGMFTTVQNIFVCPANWRRIQNYVT